MSEEEDRKTEAATVLNRVATAAYPADFLAPWMSHYNKRTEALIVGTRTIAEIAEELDRQVWMKEHQNGKGKPTEPKGPEEPKTPADKMPETPPENEEAEELFDLSKMTGAAYMFGYCLNRLAANTHNYAPSIDGFRTKQAIALAKAQNPGISVTEPKPRSRWEKLTGKGKERGQIAGVE